MSSKVIAFSLPREIIDKIDSDKGDCSRSRFLLRLIEIAYKNLHRQGGKN